MQLWIYAPLYKGCLHFFGFFYRANLLKKARIDIVIGNLLSK